MATEILVPVLGESITEATLGEWLKQPGEAVAADEPVASLETDKVSVEVPAPAAGVMGQHAVQPGDTVNVGAMIGTIEAGDGAAAAPKAEAAPAAAPTPAPAPAEAAQQAPAPAEHVDAAALSPSVRRAILEHGVDQGHGQGRPHHQGGCGRRRLRQVERARCRPGPGRRCRRACCCRPRR